MFNVLLYIYLIAIGISFITSLTSFKYGYPRHLKAFGLFLGASFLVEVIANELFPLLHLNRYRNALYNSFSLVEFIFYAGFFYTIMEKRWIKKTLLVFICLFPLIWAKLVFDEAGFFKWHGDQIAVGGFFIASFALLYIYYLSSSDDLLHLSKHSEFWIAIALLLFYSCEAPFMGTLVYVSTHYLPLAKFLLKFSMAINAIMYLIFTYAFLCRRNRYS